MAKVLEKPIGANSIISTKVNGVHKFNFSFKKRTFNEKFVGGIVSVPLRSCLILHNAKIKTKKRALLTQQQQQQKDRLWIKTQPKWFTHLNYLECDIESGELTEKEHVSDCFKQANARKIKALNKFCDMYQPQYTKRHVSLILHTFTRSTHAKISFRDMLQSVKYHYEKQMGLKVFGFIWAFEISKELHPHYHLCICVNRFHVNKIPKELKFEKNWGQRTGVEFVKYNIRNYLSKYFAKDNYRAFEKRSYGISRKLISPFEVSLN